MATDATDPTVNATGVPMGVGTVVAATYEVTDLLGQGGMGAVWAARHLRLPGKRVALKVLHGGGRDGDAYARFRREAEIASRIGHPNIVEISDFNTLADGTPYLVLEYLEGENLGTRLARGPLSPPVAMDVLRQIGSALHAAHRAGIVHRDLKPENIFLCPTDAGGVVHDRVKVLDFGISKIKGSQTVVTQDAVLIGTPRYMAPEQALGRNQEIDARTDLFALGAIVYEMLAGRPPFDGEAVAGLVYAIVHEPHAALATVVPGVPAEVSAAIDKALAKRPADRFADIAGFVEAVTGRPLETLRGSASGASAVAAASGPASASRGPASATGGTGIAGSAAKTDPWAATAASVPGTLVLPAAAASSTGARASVEAAPSVTAVSRSGGGRRVALVVLVGLVLVGGAASVLVMRAPAPDSDNKAARPPESSVGSTGTERKAADVVRPPPAEMLGMGGAAATQGAQASDANAAEPKEATTDKTAPSGEGAGKKRRGGAREKQQALSPAAESDVTAAEAALAKGDAATAIRLAQHSLYTQKSSRAFAVMVKARCRQGDLGGARASLAQVAASARTGVLRDCAAHGMDLR